MDTLVGKPSDQDVEEAALRAFKRAIELGHTGIVAMRLAERARWLPIHLAETDGRYYLVDQGTEPARTARWSERGWTDGRRVLPIKPTMFRRLPCRGA